MRLGVFTALLGRLPLDAVLRELQALGVTTVELGTGNYPGDPHCKLAMLEDAGALREFKKKLEDSGFTISALSCHGNALHPDGAIAQAHRDVSRRTVELAARLGVPVAIDFSGCPGDGGDGKYPNWVTCPWPPEYRELLERQWEREVTPYWKEHGRFAAERGVKIAVEMHPGFVVYNPETMLRLRAIAGEWVGCNYDPSHLFWQGIDPIAAIPVLGDAIFHVHAKDTQMYAGNLAAAGVLDTKPYTDERHRAWMFRTVGYGYGAEWWREFISTLRMYGYDGVLSIEHEDSLLTVEEGLRKAIRFLETLVIREKPSDAFWV